MSKIAFIADIHGNYPALKAVLNDIEKRDIDQIICLGDLVGYYSMINEVLNTIQDRNIPAICGNHDFAMVFNNGIIDRSKTCTRILGNQLTFISDANLEYLAGLPHQLVSQTNGNSFFCVHGGLNDPIDEYLLTTDEAYYSAHAFGYNFLVTGHTHKFINNKTGAITHINPGSVGQPRDDDARASYLITDGFKTEQVRVIYDIDEIVNDMISKGFEEYIYQGLYTGRKIG